jgi:hypothetical protein
MSLLALEWALRSAPASDPVAKLILVMLADHAGEDGCEAHPSMEILAKDALVDVDQVQRHLAALQERGVIASPRTGVYDLQIPYGWFGSAIDRINGTRADLGLPPLTRQTRPPLGPAVGR